jgi:hypothetical protein
MCATLLFLLQATWLLNQVGSDLPMPREFDDPGVTCNNILNWCKKLGFASPPYPPFKLTVGVGHHCECLQEIGLGLTTLTPSEAYSW